MKDLERFAARVVQQAQRGPVAVMVYPGQIGTLVCWPVEWLRGRVFGLIGVYDRRVSVGAVLADIEAAMEAK